jgi:hypothetical protein
MCKFKFDDQNLLILYECKSCLCEDEQVLVGVSITENSIMCRYSRSSGWLFGFTPFILVSELVQI